MFCFILLVGCQQDAPVPTQLPPQLPPAQPTDTVQPSPTPELTVPQLDGVISPGEWEGARVERFADGSELLLIQTAETLYLAIRADTPELIAGNVFIRQGGQVRIYHTSAALGTAIYQQEGDIWVQTKGFGWCCRDTTLNDALEEERTAFLAQEGWMGANSWIGTPNELEYQIALGEEDFHLAVNYLLVSNPDEKIPFPADLTDDCILPTPGYYPNEFQFSPESWMLVSVAP